MPRNLARITASLGYADHEFFTFFGDSPLAHGLMGTRKARDWASLIAILWMKRSAPPKNFPFIPESQVQRWVEETYAEMAKYKSGTIQLRGQDIDAADVARTFPGNYSPSDSWSHPSNMRREWRTDLSYSECTDFRLHLDGLVNRLKLVRQKHNPKNDVKDYRYGSSEYRIDVEESIASYLPGCEMTFVSREGVPFDLREDARHQSQRLFMRITGRSDAGDIDEFDIEVTRLYGIASRFAKVGVPAPAYPKTKTLENFYLFCIELMHWCENGELGNFSSQLVMPVGRTGLGNESNLEFTKTCLPTKQRIVAAVNLAVMRMRKPHESELTKAQWADLAGINRGNVPTDIALTASTAVEARENNRRQKNSDNAKKGNDKRKKSNDAPPKGHYECEGASHHRLRAGVEVCSSCGARAKFVSGKNASK